jgi:predicted phage terminase large subunit-like protein
MVSMILEISPPSNRPLWEPSKRSLTWPNGAQALAFSAEEPERIRGYGFEICWVDELCAFGRNIDATWDQLQFTMRRGRRPRQCVTTTPKPLPLLRKLLARDDVVITRGSTRDNPHLSKELLASITARYAGTRLGRQELDAEILIDIENSLWTHEMLERARAPHHVPDMERVVVAVNPSGTAGASDSGDAIGIVVAGKGSDGRCYVLGDWTVKASPDVWGRRVVDAYRHFAADRVCAERNFGGALVENLLRTIDPNVSYREVVASRGKVQRAEPIAALYEQGRVSHVLNLAELEAQMLLMTSQGYQGDGLPDRADALVWALTELLIEKPRPQFIFG